MTTLLHETWETGPNGATCGTGTTAFNGLISHWTFDNTHVPAGQGTLSGKVVAAATTAQARANLATPSDRGYAELWIWAAALPSVDLTIASHRTTGSVANLAELRLYANGSVGIRNAGFTAIATSPASTFVLSAWNKIQWYYDNASAQQRVRVFTTNPAGNTPDYDSGLVTTTAGGQIGLFQIGAVQAVTWTAWFGDVDLNDAAFLVTSGSTTVGFRAATSAQAADTGHNTVVTVPGTVVAGDEMVLQFVASQSTTQTDPTGWTKLPISQSITGLAFDAWHKIAVSGDIGATVTVVSSNTASLARELHLDVFSGAKVGNATSALAATSTTAHSTPTVVAVDPGAWILNGCGDRGAPPSSGFTMPSTLTQRSVQIQTAGTAVSSVTGSDDAVGSGSVGSNVITGTLATTKAVVWTIAIEPTASTSSLTVNAGSDLFIEPWRALTITPTASGTIDSWTWKQLSPPTPDIVTGATVDVDGTIHLTTPPALSEVAFTIQVVGHRSGVTPNPTDNVVVTVFPATRWFVTATGLMVPIRYMRVT